MDPFVRILSFNEHTIRVLHNADLWSNGSGKMVDVNAIDNGKHSSGSLHGSSLAWDLDVNEDKSEDLQSLARWLGKRLDPSYEIIVEPTHVHIEWDTHRGK
jgi:hypothetical protein